MKSLPVATPASLAVLALCTALLAGCGSGSLLGSDKIDYKSASAKTEPLEVPPDLSQLARDNRFTTQGGVISASSTLGATAPAALATGSGGSSGSSGSGSGSSSGSSGSGSSSSVAMLSKGDVRVERAGQQRWLVVPMTPEQLWPELRAFWAENGFTLTTDNPEAGVMETNWAENRAKLPQDIIRNTLGRLIDNLYDTGERDLFRTRVERTADGAEVYLTHQGLEETYTNETKDITAWRPRAQDPELEAEFLTRLMTRLGKPEPAARAAVDTATERPARARLLAGQPGAALEVDDGFERAWRRVGLALDRSGFSVEDRDRAAGVYFVRYVDPTQAGKGAPGFFARLFDSTPQGLSGPQRYRVALKAADGKTTVSVLSANGDPEGGDAGRRIVERLVSELR